MTHRGRVAVMALGLALVAATTPGKAQDYPTKPVTIVCESAAGSTPDVDTRFFADGLTKIWKQQVITVNKPGGGGSIGARFASEAVPDGYTLYMPALSSFVALPGVAPNLPLQLPRDFVALGFTAENPMFIAVNPALGVNTLPELIALAKKKPGTVSYATTGVGRLTNLTGELLQMRAGIELILVPYNGGPAHAAADVANGRVNFIIEGYSGIAAAVKGGMVKLIAVASAKRLPEFPDLPTVAETLPGVTATGWQIMAAPNGTPEPILKKVSADTAIVAEDATVKQKLSNLGSYSHAMTAAEALDFVHQQQAMWRPVMERIAAKAK